MKFAEHLGAHITPEWRKQYIQYEEMKAKLAEATQEAPSVEVVEPEVVQRYYAKFDEAFFTFSEKELTKINIFYAEKLAEAQRKFATLNAELALSAEPEKKKEVRFLGLGKSSNKDQQNVFKVPARKLQDLKLAFSEYYLSLVLLQNYQNLNYTGFRKILKKHDKNLNTDSGARWRKENVDCAMFYTNKEIDKLIQDTEATFINDLEGGDRQKAMKRLRVPPLGDQQSPWTTFKLGFWCGAFIVLLIAVVLSGIFYDYSMITKREDWPVVIRLFRGPLLIILFIFLIGINVYGWGSSGVNHVLIFELDPRNHLSYQHLMEVSSILGVVWTLHLLLFLYADYLAIPAYVSPLSLLTIMLVFMLNPTKTLMHDARFWFLRVFGRICLAPFFYVGFADFWIGDQLNSLATAFTDFHYVACFYTTPNATVNGELHVATNINMCVKGNYIRAAVSILPAWFRFAQCLRRYRDTREAFPHLVNAGKYSTTFFVAIFSSLNVYFAMRSDDEDDDDHFNVFFYLWMIAAVVSSLYAYTWDIKMDWGLLDKNAGENTLLREEMVYGSKNYYYFAIVEDFILRFGWSVSVALTQTGHILGDMVEWLPTILAILEVTRRFIWNFFRLENEHLNNCGKFRAVRDISVAPIDASDQADIIRMMDEADGVHMVRKRKTNKNAYKVKGPSELLKPLLENEQFSSLAANI